MTNRTCQRCGLPEPNYKPCRAAYVSCQYETDTTKFDYELQAWATLIDGEWWIEDCGHTEEMHCHCKGRIYKGYKLEDVPRDQTI